ncbi:HAMP domain-containing histidine kinase [Virgibacillus sp. MSP4-1]|uniref:sensor histidine kinase n=1 Tax=Virgibacillus sp. MSP4-1 TaxID=2700081 RepID=UPI0003A84E47|nr:HAMP domain-containing sensor histidine kinase [Virgibacillus sp. MSP4-1]QHS22808.1 HAMP domain-containing histidine kinase [Virgibacillus sp. MSP4-1]
MKKFFKSLLAKYILIILTALFIIQIGFFVPAFLFIFTSNQEETERQAASIEKQWHNEASDLERMTKGTILDHFKQWKQQYPQSSMFWVDNDGHLSAQLDVTAELPDEWTPAFTAQFIKERYDEDPFTVIAFAGNNQSHGFIVFELPRSALSQDTNQFSQIGGRTFSIIALTIILFFIMISLLFFRGIRKRLVALQEAMEIRDTDQLPVSIDVKKNDEIGQLESTFNQMVSELRESKQREQEEEQLRRELIANLSHDLRTPLTKMRAHLYSISKETLSANGVQAVQVMEEAMEKLDRLIENLMSYTLLTARKMNDKPENIDIIRHMRTSMASWYSIFEKEGFEIDVELKPFKENEWNVDPLWLDRIIDNLLQNVLRHAQSGKFLSVRTESGKDYEAIVIADHGNGMSVDSSEKGAGIGLTIVDLMVRKMNLEWEVESGHRGTIIKIKRLK